MCSIVTSLNVVNFRALVNCYRKIERLQAALIGPDIYKDVNARFIKNSNLAARCGELKR